MFRDDLILGVLCLITVSSSETSDTIFRLHLFSDGCSMNIFLARGVCTASSSDVSYKIFLALIRISDSDPPSSSELVSRSLFLRQLPFSESESSS
uniref:Putative secreted protein n=1 Tax=Panstrongylus lignarius TaxID=156445 RepID=A0A224Y1Y1_9HEMI